MRNNSQWNATESSSASGRIGDWLGGVLSDRKSRPWRLGLDLGTNSLGWCVFDLKKGEDGRQHPADIRRMGVRIYTDGRDPQSGASLAQARRGPRGARRRRDRYLDRRADLLRALIRHGLMPADPAARKRLEALDPWQLRGEGLDRALTPYAAASRATARPSGDATTRKPRTRRT
jgi:CRISPR/Cas system Type II protein with McrA/HNH and RuvC-like nuclease domain